MNNKKIKIFTAVALSLVAVSALFLLALLLFGVIGDSVESLDSSSNDLGQGIAYGCAVATTLVVILFALIVKAVSLGVGALSCIAKKRKASIVTASVFACVMAVLSAILGVLAIASYSGLTTKGSLAISVHGALIFALVTDLFWIAVAVCRAVVLSKRSKAEKPEQN